MTEEVARADGSLVLQGARILLVEDDFFILIELESVLTTAGAEKVFCCRSVDEALATLDNGSVGVAVLDVRVGTRTVAPVASDIRRRGIPYLFYTGQPVSDPDLVEWSVGGQGNIIAKPAAPKTIVTAVADLLAR